jgi:hypothetical protein
MKKKNVEPLEEALKLAEALEHQVYRGSYDWERVEPIMLKAAAELRRSIEGFLDQTRKMEDEIKALKERLK